jgi:hypothetical protein
MNRLINDTLIGAGILSDIANTPDPVSMWFRGVNVHDVMFYIVIPLVFIIGLAFIAKSRYTRRMQRLNNLRLAYYRN